MKNHRVILIPIILIMALLVAAGVAANPPTPPPVNGTNGVIYCEQGTKPETKIVDNAIIWACIAGDPTPVPTATVPPTETPPPTATPDPSPTPPPPTVTPPPIPTVTPTPDDCDPLAVHGWDTPPCAGEPPHTHVGLTVGTATDPDAFACDWVVPPSVDDGPFGDWRAIVPGADDDRDFGFANATLGEVGFKAAGYGWVNGCNLPSADNAVTIEAFATLQHRMFMPLAQNVRFHSEVIMVRLSDGTVAITSRWADTQMLNAGGDPVPLWTDGIVCPATMNPDDNPEACFDAPYPARSHADSGAGRLAGLVDGVVSTTGIWYKSPTNVDPLGMWFESPTTLRATNPLGLSPHIITFGVLPSANGPTLHIHDVYGCRAYSELLGADATSPCAGNSVGGGGHGLTADAYWLPLEKRAAGVTYLSQATEPGRYSIRFDNSVLTGTTGQQTDK